MWSMPPTHVHLITLPVPGPIPIPTTAHVHVPIHVHVHVPATTPACKAHFFLNTIATLHTTRSDYVDIKFA